LISSAKMVGAPHDGIRVMIVDDSRVVRSIISGWLSAEPDLTIAGLYSDGQSAADRVVEARPDVVVLDIEMPGMDGLTALPLMLRKWPRARVLIASTLTKRGAAVSLEALTLGAADYIAKPDSSIAAASDSFRTELIAKIRVLGQRPRRHADTEVAMPPLAPVRCGPPVLSDGAASKHGTHQKLRSSRPNLVVVASSTGGPQALMTLFSALGPAIRSIPVLVVQHMPPTFTSILAEHIGRVAGCTTKEGIDGEGLPVGEIRVAPGGRHMEVVRAQRGLQIRLTDDQPVNFCRPSADVLFDAAARACGRETLAIVLTGMGNDGAVGARAIFDAGGYVVAQDEATSVVWGMPRAVVLAGAATEVLPVGKIGPRVSAHILGR